MTRRGFLGGLAAIVALPVVAKAKAQEPGDEEPATFKDTWQKPYPDDDVLAAFDNWIDYQTAVNGTHPIAVQLHPNLYCQVQTSLRPMLLPGTKQPLLLYNGVQVHPDPCGLTAF